MAELGAIVRAAKSAGTDDVQLKVADLLQSKAALVDLIDRRVSHIERMVEASGKKATSCVSAELETLASQRASLLPKPSAAKKAEKKEKKRVAQEVAGPLQPASAGAAEPAPNPLPWPETVALPIHVVEVVNAYIDLLSAPHATTDELAHAYARVDDLMHGARVTASYKLDGTNVGKEAEGGGLVGRRLRIDDAASEYQRTSLAALRPIDASRFKQVLMSDLMSEVAACDAGRRAATCVDKVTLYGELVCNDLYDYRKMWMVAGWRAFGARRRRAGRRGQRCSRISSGRWRR